MKRFITVLSFTLLTPAIAFAQLNHTEDLLEKVKGLVNTSTIIVGGIALLVFFWGLVQFIRGGAGDEKAIAAGRNLMIWGTVALFVMVSVWGLVHFIQEELLPAGNFNNESLPSLSNY